MLCFKNKEGEINKYNHIVDSSKFLHESKMLGFCYALYHLVAILYMFVKILDSRVEDIPKTMLPKVLNANYTVDLGKRVFIV